MTDSLIELEAAVQRHIAELYEGALVDSWVLITSSENIDAHDLSNYRLVTPETQPHHVDAGLVHIGKAIIRDAWDSSWEDDDD